MRNRERTYSGCPVLTLATQIAPYLDHGAVPGNAEYLEVPPGKGSPQAWILVESWLSHA